MSHQPPIEHLHRFPAAPPGWYDHSYVALADGAFALIRVDKNFQGLDPAQVYQSWRDAHLLISRFPGDEGESVTIRSPPFPKVDQRPDGSWVVVGGRKFDGESNGFIFEADGRLVTRFDGGDAIMNMSVAGDGSIWLGYFDEGVFGHDRLSQHGLVCLEADGTLRWAFPQGQDSGFIDDCYALTPCGTDAWACPYSDFPILRIGGGVVRQWTNTTRGARAICAAGDHVILAGGYGDDFNLVRLVRLGATDTSLVAEARLLALEKHSSYFQGRGSSMFAFMATEVAEIAVTARVAVA